MSGFLKDINIIEMGTYVVVPKACRMMADWGASVTKVELPGGEVWRYYGRALSLPSDPLNNIHFQTENANKRCICLDLKTPEGMEALMRMLETADVFLTNTRTKSLVKMGLDYETLKEKFPRLIYANFTGMGEEGAEKDAPGYDVSAFWARSGILYEWALKENIPFKPKPGFGDSTTAPALVAAVMAALYNRTKTGKGEKIKMSLLASGLFYNSVSMLAAQFQERDSYPESHYHLKNPSYAVYKTLDNDWILFSITNWDVNSRFLLEALELKEHLGDPKLCTLNGVKEHITEAIKLFEQAIKKMHTDEVLNALRAKDIVCEKLMHPCDVAHDKQAWANGYLREVTLPGGVSAILPNNPIKFENISEVPFTIAPLLGEHSERILKELGYSEEEISLFLEKKIAYQAQL